LIVCARGSGVGPFTARFPSSSAASPSSNLGSLRGGPSPPPLLVLGALFTCPPLSQSQLLLVWICHVVLLSSCALVMSTICFGPIDDLVLYGDDCSTNFVMHLCISHDWCSRIYIIGPGFLASITFGWDLYYWAAISCFIAFGLGFGCRVGRGVQFAFCSLDFRRATRRRRERRTTDPLPVLLLGKD
jgi:hypothetical protein